jgi:hypothetical protein
MPHIGGRHYVGPRTDQLFFILFGEVLMKGFVFSSILVTYALLLASTGYLSFLHFPGLTTLPNPEMIDRAAKSEIYRVQLLKDVETARDRREQLVKLASHSFDVILGALLGFLSAVAAATALTGGNQAPSQSQPSNNRSHNANG